MIALQTTSVRLRLEIRPGHRVISRLAEKHMTPAAKAGVAALLEPGELLADASLWADQNRPG